MLALGNSALQNGDRLEVLLIHTSGQWMRASMPLRVIDETQQGMNSAITTGRRIAQHRSPLNRKVVHRDRAVGRKNPDALEIDKDLFARLPGEGLPLLAI